MHEVVHEEINGPFRIAIQLDDARDNNPREWDNLGTMVCWHRRYNLGDEQSLENLCALIEVSHRPGLTMDRLIDSAARKAVMLPLYLYDHSGITMNTTGFSCAWDSGLVGFIYVSLEDVRKEYGVKRVTQALRERVSEQLKCEVSTYDDYLTGNVYSYQIEQDNEIIGSCGGFLGDYQTNCLLQARQALPLAA